MISDSDLEYIIENPDHTSNLNTFLLARELREARKVVEAGYYRLRLGHNDTCAHALSEEYDCTCGQTQLRGALIKHDEATK